jgi:hypothetical protein
MKIIKNKGYKYFNLSGMLLVLIKYTEAGKLNNAEVGSTSPKGSCKNRI